MGNQKYEDPLDYKSQYVQGFCPAWPYYIMLPTPNLFTARQLHLLNLS